MAALITSQKQGGLTVTTTESKGKGVIATIPFKKGDYVCSYSGELLTRTKGIEREQEYSDDVGCYIFFFSHKGVDMW